MDYRVVGFEQAGPQLWDEWVSSIGESTYLHGSAFLQFLHLMVPADARLSFAVLENERTPIALCPCSVNATTAAGIGFVEGSWGGAPLGAPAIRSATPSVRRKYEAEAYRLLHERIAAAGARRCLVRKHFATRDLLGGGGAAAHAALSPLLYGYECQPQNTAVLDLRTDEETLFAEASRYQRKNIKLARRSGMRTLVLRGPTPELDEMFARYDAAHLASAGRRTRPQESFDHMRDLVAQGRAGLFVGLLADEPVSFLYVGEFEGLAYGWSQVNRDEFEEGRSLRHALEWDAAMHYRDVGFSYYEVGTLWSPAQPYKVPSSKELSIAEFKRRYGGVLLPELVFERAFDEDLWAALRGQRTRDMVESGLLGASIPSEVPDAD